MNINKLSICMQKLKTAIFSMDRVLAFALLLAVIFSLNGIRWGRVECWNRDQMALRSLGSWGMPKSFSKPPFHTFLNRVLVTRPIDEVEKSVGSITRNRPHYNEAKLLGSRFLVLALFLGMVVLAFKICGMYFGVFAGRFVALALAGSAGFIEYNHFLTCDAPLLFWMMLAVYFSARVNATGARSAYLLAGLITGVATNTKYNGLAVGITLVVAHCLRNGLTWKERFFSKDLMLGLLMVPVGIIATNPYMLFDYKRFVSDFMYNYTVTPRYGGDMTGSGYVKFIAEFPEILGWPGAIMLGVCVAGSLLVLCVRGRSAKREATGFAIIASVFVLYFLKIGSFPRMETRFVLPSVPLAILLAGPFLGKVTWVQRGIAILCVPIFIYNVVCSVVVGNRFNSDPRLLAQEWIKANVKPGYRIESSGASPHWFRIDSLQAKEFDAQKPDWKKEARARVLDLRMPRVNGRAEAFDERFQGNEWVEGKTALHEGQFDESIFNLKCLQERNPDVVSVYDGDASVPSPIVRSYYADMLSERFAYKIVFDRQSPPVPQWVYPRNIDFLVNRTILLMRK